MLTQRYKRLMQEGLALNRADGRHEVRVHIDGETCTGHGRCAKYGPNVYRLDAIDGYNSDRERQIVGER